MASALMIRWTQELQDFATARLVSQAVDANTRNALVDAQATMANAILALGSVPANLGFGEVPSAKST